jgi:signal transduction histidine kinase
MKNLTTRLVIFLMLALMAITGVFDYVRLRRERERIVEQTGNDQRIFADTLALAIRRNVRRGRTTEELQELLDEILSRPDLVLVAIYDPRGSLFAHSVTEGLPAPAADEVIRETLRTGDATSQTASRDGAQDLRYLRPFPWPDGQTAVVEVRQSLAGIDQVFARAVREVVLYRLVVLALFVLSIAAVTRWSIARPMRVVIRGARAIGSGDLTQRIDVHRSDELGALAEEFNRMAENLERAHHALLRQSEERLTLEREAQQAQKLAAVGMLAAEVAHEVGTPLNVIYGRAEVLDRALAADHPGRRHLEVILRQTERITGIIRALLDYTRPRRPTLREEALPPLLARAVDLLAGRDRARRVRIELPADLPTVRADADQLQQLFLNLLTNALDAAPPDSMIRVTAGSEPILPEAGRAGIVRGKSDSPTLTIHVVDDGPGMTADELAHVFEPFFSTKKRGQGTGLGLPIVEEIVRAHEGEVEILSIPGRGTEVLVRLPLATPPASAPVGDASGKGRHAT